MWPTKKAQGPTETTRTIQTKKEHLHVIYCTTNTNNLICPIPRDFFVVLFKKGIWYLKSCFAFKDKIVINQLRKQHKLDGNIYE